MSLPVYAIAYRDAALVINRASEKFWISFRPHREISTGLGISAVVHLTLLIGIGSALYIDGKDDRDLPELSVQLVAREGPNDEEFTEASLPLPAPDPADEVVEDPGNSEQTFDAPMVAEAMPQLLDEMPDITQLEGPTSFIEPAPAAGAVLTTTSESTADVPMIVDAHPDTGAVPEVVTQPEQVMLRRNMQELAKELLDTDAMVKTISWQQNGQEYSARVQRKPAPDSTGLEQVIAEVVTSKDGKQMKTRLSLKRLAFSHFTQLVNNWDPNIMLHDDVIDGRFHSNSEISLSTMAGIKPKFFGKVTTAATKVTFNDFNPRRNKDVFQGGIETRTDRVTLPRDMPDIVNGGTADAARRSFMADTRIIFNADGSYAWRLASGEGELHRSEPSEHPQYLIGEKGAKLYVRGTVRGIFTVYSPSDIEIEDDVVYLKDPRQTVISRDFLALISGRDIKVAAGTVTGPGDLTVHAALFARRRFFTEAIEQSKPATMFIYGSLTAGTITATEPRYATKLDYDSRFEYLRPASFPMTRRYEVDSWDEDWREVQGGEPEAVAGSSLAQSE